MLTEKESVDLDVMQFVRENFEKFTHNLLAEKERIEKKINLFTDNNKLFIEQNRYLRKKVKHIEQIKRDHI
jgi:hypothetical protein